MYGTGMVMGFEIDRDETRAVLVAHLGLSQEAHEALMQYEAKWVPDATSKRAKLFLTKYRNHFGLSAE